MSGLRPERIRGLIEAAASVVGHTELDSLLRSTVETARELTGARYAAVGVIGSHKTLVEFIHSGLDAETADKIGRPPQGLGVLGTITRQGKTVRIDEVSEHPDSVGMPDHHPEMHTFLGVPLRVGDQVFGNLYLTEKDGGFSEQDEVTVELLAATAGAAISTLRLHERLRRAALNEDRERIARDLHDSIIQDLFAMGLGLQASVGSLESDPDAVRTRIDEAVDRLDATIQSLRRYIFDLQPPVWARPSIEAELQSLIDELSDPHDLEVTLQVSCSPGYPEPGTAEHVLAIVKEALSNALRHSGAATISVRVECLEDRVVATISDDGSGFDSSADHRGLGLGNMARRAARAGGVYNLESAEGVGTTVHVELPI